MKTAKFFLMFVATVFMGQVHAVGWEELPAFELTADTPIIFTPKENTLVLDDPTGLLTVEDVLKRKDEFKPPAEMAPLDTRHSYWIMQRISSRLSADRNYRLEGNWLSIHTHVIRADDSIVALKTAGFFTGKYSFLSNIDPALPSSAKVQSRDALFMLHSGETLSLLSRAKARHALPPRSYVLQFVDNERYLETRRFGLYIEGALLGILFALAIFGWYSYFVNKDRAGLFYGTWISFAFMQILTLPSQDGSHFTEFIVNANDKYFGAVSISGLFAFISAYGQIIFYFLFASAFLQVSKYHSKTQKLIYFLIVYFLLHMLANILLVHDIGPQVFYGGNAFLPILVFVFLYAAALQRYRQGMSVAIFWLVASIPYFVFRLIFVSGLMGYPSVFSYLPESGISYLLQNTNVSQSIALCAEALIMALAVISRNVWVQKELAKSIDAQKTLVEGQNKVLEETVAERTKELAEQHHELDEAHQLVVGSVNYASRLQRGQLPRQIRIDGRFASFATIWEPRDTIGGDLYWLSSSQQSGPYVLAVADCTGHGVPGAMLSLLVSNSLERIYANDTSEDPATALMSLDHYVRTGLNQDRADSESDDGCDAAVLRIDRDKQTIEFAGAKLGLFQVSASGVLTRHQGARCSLGYQDPIEDKDKPVVQTIRYQAGDSFAIVTDGLTDQIGGNASIKTSFGYRRIENILKANCISDADYIAYKLKNDFLAWQDNETRRDDLTAVVFKL
jgi:serine phosphatase RsbU (regulator of sigma subunit)